MINIIFFGTPEFGKKVLENILAYFDVKAVVTQPDRPVGRRQVMTPSPVKVLAQKHNIPILTPSNKQELLAVSRKLLAIKPDLLVVAAYGMIIPKEVIDIPKYGSINVHPSLLPKYRGPSPIQAALLNGDKQTGVTIMLMDEEMDHGPLLAQKKVEVGKKEKLPELSHKLAKIGGEMLIDTLPKWVSGKTRSRPQDHKKATYTKIIKKDDGRIDWPKVPRSSKSEVGTRTDKEIYNMWRAYYPWPGIWTTIGELKQYVGADPSVRPSLDKRLKILECHLDNGQLIIDEVQVEGGKPISWREFENGYTRD